MQTDLIEPLVPRQGREERAVVPNGQDGGLVHLDISSSPENDETGRFSGSKIRLALVAGQWIWPPFLFALASGTYWYLFTESALFGAALVGNFILLAILWRNAEDNKLRCTDVLPTISWGLLLALAWFPECFVLFLLLLPIVFGVLYMIGWRNAGLTNGVKRLVGNLCLNPVESLSRRAYNFKQMEEDFFEDLDSTEEERNRKLEAQQESLRHLEDLESSTKSRPSMWPIYVVIVIGVWSVCFLVYYGVVVMPSMEKFTASQEKKIPRFLKASNVKF